MAYNDVRDDFMTILDRDDCTTDQADVFMTQSMQRIQRVCRLPSLERALLITPTADAMTQFPVPTDLIQFIDLLVPTIGSCTGQFTPLKKLSYRGLMQKSNAGYPHSFARMQTVVYLRGALPIGTQMQVLYYGNCSVIQDSATDDNELTGGCPDLVIYGALIYAGNYFEHPLTAMWTQTYNTLLAEVMSMAADLENEGGLIEVEPYYEFND